MNAIVATLVPVVIQAVFDLAAGKPVEEVMPKLQAAAVAYKLAVGDWEQAKKDNPIG